jgi:hypothetical protein
MHNDDHSPAAYRFKGLLDVGKCRSGSNKGRANGFDMFAASKPFVTGRVSHRTLRITPA